MSCSCTCTCSVVTAVAQYVVLFVDHPCPCMSKLHVHVAVIYMYVNVYSHRDTCAEVLFEDDADDQSLPVAILDALMKVHVRQHYIYSLVLLQLVTFLSQLSSIGVQSISHMEKRSGEVDN